MTERMTCPACGRDIAIIPVTYAERFPRLRPHFAPEVHWPWSECPGTNVWYWTENEASETRYDSRLMTSAGRRKSFAVLIALAAVGHYEQREHDPQRWRDHEHFSKRFRSRWERDEAIRNNTWAMTR